MHVGVNVSANGTQKIRPFERNGYGDAENMARPFVASFTG